MLSSPAHCRQGCLLHIIRVQTENSTGLFTILVLSVSCTFIFCLFFSRNATHSFPCIIDNPTLSSAQIFVREA